MLVQACLDTRACTRVPCSSHASMLVCIILSGESGIMHSETASVTWRVGLLLVQLAGPIREVSISAGTD